MSRFRVGMIGAAGILPRHTRVLKDIEDVEMVCVADISREALERTLHNEPYLESIRTYRNWKKMLDKEELEGVIVCTPHTLHFKQIMEALDRGLHVLSEKPLACKATHAHAIAEKARQTGKVVHVAFQRRGMGTTLYARELIETGRLGKVYYVEAHQTQAWIQYAEGKWRGDPRLSGGGQLNDSGSHLIDRLLFITQLKPSKVLAFIDNQGLQVDVLTAASMQFEGGAIGTLSVVGRVENNIFAEDTTIYCEKGYIAIGGILSPTGDMTIVIDGKPHDLPGNVKSTTQNAANWMDSIRGKAENLSPPEQSIVNLQLTEALWKSGRTGRVVHVIA